MADLVRHVVCPSCSAINRVPATRSALDAKCGTCHNKLFTGQPAKVDGKGFESHIARNDIPCRRRLLGALVRTVPGHGAGL